MPRLISNSDLATLARAAIAIAAPAGLLGAHDARPVTPSTLGSRIIAALGGDARLRQLHSIKLTGTMEGVSGFPGTYQLIASYPDRRRVDWDIRYLKRTVAFDGASAWDNFAAVREIAGDELQREKDEARFLPLYQLLKTGREFDVAAGTCPAGQSVYLLSFKGVGSGVERYGVDRSSFLPLCQIREEPYEEGPTTIVTEFSDYKTVDGITLPFRVREARPDNSLTIQVTRYDLNPTLPAETFANPQAAFFRNPISVQLETLPRRIFKESDGNYTVGSQRLWGMYFYSNESWSMDLFVRERHGRYLDPVQASAEFYSGNIRVGSRTWDRPGLLELRRFPVARFTPQGEIYGFRHNFSAAQRENIDRLRYTFVGRSSDGRLHTAQLDIPVTVYRPKTKLIFPVRGKFLITTGHEFYEIEHKYERSQQFSIDVVALGDNFEFAKNNGARAEDYVGYARREIIAPAEGTVAFARNDIPDGAVKADFLKLPDAITAPAGNVVILDHGNGEFSIFCHMHFGSVRVKTGDHVRQGQVLGLMGAAGSPGLPHLHYQLQDGPNIFGNDGLPLKFTNIERVAWLGRRGADDDRGSAPVDQPRSGIYMEAR